jgi:predicted ArsR family transcriptional regulator
MTAAQLCERLEVGSTAVRQHLDRLRAEGWIEVTGLQRGMGRPGQIFDLTDQANDLFPQQYETLAMDLLDAIEALPDGDDILNRILEARRKKWEDQHRLRLAEESLEDRLRALTEILNEQGNMAEYEVLPDGTYTLTEHHCTICRVAEQHPFLCEQDRTWFEEELGAQVKAVKNRATGDSHCLFRIIPHTEP